MAEYLYVFDMASTQIYEIKLDKEDVDMELEDILNRRHIDLFDGSISPICFSDKKLEVESIDLEY